MIPSPEDSPWRSEDYQSELRNLGSTFKADGLDVHDVGTHPARAGCQATLSGEWMVKLCATLGSTLGAPVGSWLQTRRGRTVRMRIGDIEADIRTVEELVKVITIAKCYQEVTENEG